MRLELVKNIVGNEILSRNIYNQFGALILPKGQILGSNMKKRLLENGVFLVYIKDESDEKPNVKIGNYDSKKQYTADKENSPEEKIEKLKQDTLSKLPDIFDELLDKNIKVLSDLMDVVNEMVGEIQESDIINTNLYEINCYDDYTYVHCLDTAIMSIFLGKSINLSPEVMRTIGLSAILHDIGKTKISSTIINKKGKLTPEEFNIVKQHPKLGFDALRESGLKDPGILYGVLHHHERYDGKGYPTGLKGKEINYIAKIISVCDVYTAISANRSYRSRFSPNEAYEYILGGSGTIFDPVIITKFRETFSIYSIGSKVKLSNGVEGNILRQNKNFPDRPVVIAEKEDVYSKKFSYEIDLLNETKVSIVEAC
jgi:HD-GYP domain-containing protein (c-di-GMP phosphodiesterase class II)